jgi:uncharacterized protein YdeI (YjbR/CyaY-like superfamily)
LRNLNSWHYSEIVERKRFTNLTLAQKSRHRDVGAWEKIPETRK